MLVEFRVGVDSQEVANEIPNVDILDDLRDKLDSLVVGVLFDGCVDLDHSFKEFVDKSVEDLVLLDVHGS